MCESAYMRCVCLCLCVARARIHVLSMYARMYVRNKLHRRSGSGIEISNIRSIERN